MSENLCSITLQKVVVDYPSQSIWSKARHCLERDLNG